MKIKLLMVLLMVSSIFVLFMFGNCTKAKINKITDYKELNELIAEKSSLKYDIRITSECEAGHIPNFMCMGSDDNKEIVTETTELIEKLYDKDKLIIIIGEDSNVIQILSNLSKSGYKKLYYFEGGYDAYYQKAKDTFTPEEGCGC